VIRSKRVAMMAKYYVVFASHIIPDNQPSFQGSPELTAGSVSKLLSPISVELSADLVGNLIEIKPFAWYVLIIML
jgi:hypothetical protein